MWQPDAFENWPLEAQRTLVDEKLDRLLSLARAHSSLHRARLAAVPPGVALGREALPFIAPLDKDAWVAASPPRSNDALTGPLSAAHVFRSGGSTGDPKFSIYSHDEFNATMPLFRRTYGSAGLAPGDRVANLFAAGGLYASFKFVDRMLEAMGCLNFPYTAAADPEVVADGVVRFGLNVLVGFPSRLLQVAPVIAARGGQIEKIYYAGEHLHPADRERLAGWLNTHVIASAGYGAVDSGLMGHACEASVGGQHHVLADHVWLEVVEPETFQPVPAGEAGTLLVTHLDRLLHPVIRYQVGDAARFLPGPCACGRTTPVFELLGRTDDALRLGYATVTRTEVLQAFDTVAALGQAVQLVKQRVEGREALRIRVEVSNPVGEPQLAERLLNALLGAKPDLKKMVESGNLALPIIEVLPENGIPRLAVTGKFKGTLDETL